MYREGLSYDDVLIQPSFSKINSRTEVDSSIQLKNGPKLSTPVMSANMPSVTGLPMVLAMHDAGGIGILPRKFGRAGLSPSEYVTYVRMMKESPVDHGFTVGLSETNSEIRNMYDSAVDIGAYPILTVDLARGDSQVMVDRVSHIRKLLGPGPCIMAGNVATRRGARQLAKVGADIIKVGVGPGRACTTRLVSGVGVPQLTAIEQIAFSFYEHGLDASIVADGGLKHPGDLAKAIIAGADAVMVGGMFARCEESAGDGHYRGSSTYTSERVHEGVQMEVQQDTNVLEVLTEFDGGLRSAMSYCNARTVRDLRINGSFVRQTVAGLIESGPRFNHG